MDDADRAREFQQAEIERGIRYRKPAPRYTGNCNWCDAPVEARNKFCDADCRDDWEKDQRRNG